MDDLKAEDRALLDLARAGHEPSAADRRRLRKALAVSIGAASGLGVATAAAKTSSAAAGAAGAAPAATLATTLATKLIVAAIVATAIGGGAVALHRRVPPAQVHKTAAEVPASRAATTATASPGTVASPAMESPTAEPARSPADARRAHVGARVRAAAPARGTAAAPSEAAPAVAVPVPPTTTIDTEMRLVRDGVAALHAGDPARALALLDEHARLYPGGILAEERSAERIAALKDLGRDGDARAAAAVFLKAHPNSPLAPRVRATCNLPSNP